MKPQVFAIDLALKNLASLETVRPVGLSMTTNPASLRICGFFDVQQFWGGPCILSKCVSLSS